MKRLEILSLTTILAASAGLLTFGVTQTMEERTAFTSSGYVLTGDSGENKQLAFAADTAFNVTYDQQVRFTDVDGGKYEVAQDSFVFLEDGSIMAMTGGVLLDFNDLSDNFINNYYMSARLPLMPSEGSYLAETSNGSVEFGENLWKISQGRYLVQSPTLSVYFAEDDIREVSDFIQVTTTEDGIVQMLTQDNRWVTISEDCYIETAGGVQIFPVTQLVSDGTYKMSLAKLSVSPDDSIILSEGETRRQIVPELNIEGVDGESGDSGENGVDGTIGQVGEVGQAGEVGQVGTDGEMGQSGDVGQDGVGGTAGAAGDFGEDGVSGQAGTSGEDGGNGTTGASGGEGDGGRNGKDGKNGSSGSSGVAGQNAGDSTINSALPTISVTDWNISAISLSGALLVNDKANALIYSEASYPTLVTIYNVATGETIPCYPSDKDGKVSNTSERYFSAEGNSSMDGMEWYFATDGDPLSPDTEYRLSVTGYYKSADEESSLVYSRELLSRVFYTDSTGIVLSYEGATTTTIDVNVTRWDDFVTEGAKVKVLLLTEAQSEDYTVNTEGGYQDLIIMDYAPDANGVGTLRNEKGDLVGTFDLESKTAKLTFKNLKSDSHYVVRTVVQNSSITKLSSQELEVATLKTPPTWAKGAKLTAIYNRTTGAFDLTVPTVSDLDSGIKKYIFTVYDEAGDVVTTKDILPERLSTANFYLESETYYNFGVDIEFFDNEKTVMYTGIENSGYIMSLGDSMPTLRLNQTSADSNNSWTGTLMVQLGESTKAKMDANSPWQLTLWADQLFEEPISITAQNSDVIDNPNTGRYTVSGVYDEGTRTVTFALDFKNLLNNTSYSIGVTGCVDLNDTNEFVSRNLGTVTFRTTMNPKLLATWEPLGAASALDRTVVLSFAPEEDLDEGDLVPTEAQKASALADLKKGSVLIQLYRGTGSDKVAEDYRYIQDQEQLEDLYTDGLLIDSNMFSVSASGTQAVTYSIAVMDVADQTYSKEGDLGYVNYYEDVDNNVSNVVVQPEPPELLQDPTKGVKATAILNKNSQYYGKPVDPDLPGEAIVGYKLVADYDNGQRVGETITYYAMEALSMQRTVATVDPLAPDIQKYLYSATHDISSGSDDVPGVVFFFGTVEDPDTKVQVSGPEYATFKNGYYVHYVGDPVEEPLDATTSELSKGMGRGYKYIFAYTATYKEGLSTGHKYPYEVATALKGYEDYKDAYGIGKPFRTSTENYGLNVVYMLNSGVVEAPKVAPTTHTYVASSTSELVNTAVPNYTKGEVTVNYAVEDPDNTITWIADSTSTRLPTTVTYQNGFGQYPSYGKVDIQGTQLGIKADPEQNWHSLIFPYQVDTSEDKVVLEPNMNVNWFAFDYESEDSPMMDWGFRLITERSAPLCQVPVEWAWGDELVKMHATAVENNSQSTNPLVYIDPKVKEDENKIVFSIVPTGDGNTYLTNLLSRDYGLWVRLKPTAESTTLSNEPFEILLNIDKDTASVSKYKAELPLSAIPQIGDYLNRQLKVEAEIRYDNAVQGWNLINGATETETGYFALQRMLLDEDLEQLTFERYYNASDWNSYSYDALLTQIDPILAAEDLMDSIDWLDGEMIHDQATMTLKNVKNHREKLIYLYPTNYGLDRSVVAGVENCAGTYVVPKGMGTHVFNGVSPIKVEVLVPTVKGFSYEIGRTEIDVTGINLGNGDYLNKVSNSNEIHLYLFDNVTAAKELDMSKNLDRLVATVDVTGTVTLGTDTLFDKLIEQKNYYVAVCYVNKNGVDQLFMKDGDDDTAVYTIETQGDLNIISDQGLEYANLSYFEKFFNIEVKLDRSKNVTVAYDIFKSESQPLDNATDVLMARTDLYDLFLDKTYIGSNGDILGQLTQNVKIDLKPDAARSLFEPGYTYWLRVTAYENGEEAGIQFFSTTIHPAERSPAIVKAGNVSGDAMTYSVTVVDKSFSYMGHEDNTGSGYGKYAVRFFVKGANDNDDVTTWKRYATKYDSATYPMDSAKRDFVLENLAPSTQYAIKVYAVYDARNNGASPELRELDTNGNLTYVTKSSSELFDGADADGDGLFEGDTFSKYLDGFWGTLGGSALEPNLDAVEMAIEDGKFCIGSRVQVTASSSGILIDGDMAHVDKPYPTTMVLYLTDAYGIIQKDESGNDKQMITKMEMSIVGKYADGSSITYPQLIKTQADKDFVFEAGKDSGGFASYNYTIPLELPAGQYAVTVTLYSTDSAGNDYAEINARTYYTNG